MLAIILAITFVIAAVVIGAWLIWEWRMDRIYQQDRDDWRSLTRDPDERWPRHRDL